jgi:hypothetical protein
MKQRRVRPLDRIVYHAEVRTISQWRAGRKAPEKQKMQVTKTRKTQKEFKKSTQKILKRKLSMLSPRYCQIRVNVGFLRLELITLISNKSKGWISKIRINNVDIKRFCQRCYCE